MSSTKSSKTVSGIVSFEDATTNGGFGVYNIILIIATGGCLMTVIIETMSMMFIVPASQCDLGLDLQMKGVLSAISFLGVVSSSHFWGYMADTRGRRLVLMISMFASFITSITSSIIPYAWLFIVVRFTNGLAVGGASSVVYAYIGEFHNQSYRPRVISWIATFVAFANILIPGFAWLILPLDFNYFLPLINIYFRPWRLLLIAYSLPSLIFGVWMYYLPETPKFLLTNARTDEALAVLKRVYEMNNRRTKKPFAITAIVLNEGGDERKENVQGEVGMLAAMWQQTKRLLQRPYVGKMFMVCLLQFGSFASSSGLIMWYPDLLNKIVHYVEVFPNSSTTLCESVNFFNHHDKNVETTIIIECSDQVSTDVFLLGILIGVGFTCFYLILGGVINILGAKKLLILFFLVSSICGITTHFVTDIQTIQILLMCFLCSATSIGLINILSVELFPTHLRGMALAVSLMFGRFGAVAGSNITGPLLYHYCDYTFYVFALDHLVLIITLFLLPSPRNEQKMIEPNV